MISCFDMHIWCFGGTSSEAGISLKPAFWYIFSEAIPSNILVAPVGRWENIWRQAFLYIFRELIPHSNILKRVGTSHPLEIFRIQDGGRIHLEGNIFHISSSNYWCMCKMVIFRVNNWMEMLNQRKKHNLEQFKKLIVFRIFPNCHLRFWKCQAGGKFPPSWLC